MGRRHFFRGVIVPAFIPLILVGIARTVPHPFPAGLVTAMLVISSIGLYTVRLQRYWGYADDISLELRRLKWLVALLIIQTPLNLIFLLSVSRLDNHTLLIWQYLFTRSILLFVLLALFLQLIRLSEELRFSPKRAIIGILITAFLVYNDWSDQFQFLIFFLLVIWIFKFESCNQLRSGRRIVLALFSLLGLILLSIDLTGSFSQAEGTRLIIGNITITPRIIDSIRILESSLVPHLPDIIRSLQHLLLTILIILPGKLILRPIANWLKFALRIRTKLALSYVFSSIIPACILVILLLFGMLFMMGGFWQLLVDDMIEARTATLKTLWDSSLTFLGGDPVIPSLVGLNEVTTYLRKNNISAIFADVDSQGNVENLRSGGAILPELMSTDSLIISLPEEVFDIFADTLGITDTLRIIKIVKPSTIINFPGVSLPKNLGSDSLIVSLGERHFSGIVWFARTPYLTYWMRHKNRIIGLFQPFTLDRLVAMKEQCGTDLILVPGTELNIRHLATGFDFKLDVDIKPAMQTRMAPQSRRGFDIPINFPALHPSLVWENETGFVQSFSVVLVETTVLSVFQIIFSTDHVVNRVYLASFAILSAFFGIILILVALLGFGLAGGITKSITKIRKGTQQLRKGDLSAKITISSRDELSELAESFNLMVSDINRMLEEVKEKERLEAELEAAKAIQIRLLPGSAPEIPGFDVAAASLPAKHVGGDYYDFITLPNNRLGIAVGDVSGKGMPAALLMANLQASLRAITQSDLSIETFVERLNIVLHKNTSPQMFATFFLAQIHLGNGGIDYVNAGHNFPILFNKEKSTELKEGGLVLGVMPDVKYQSGHIDLCSGDIVALYSDGITEATNGENCEYGETRLVQILQNSCEFEAKTILNIVLDDVQAYCGIPQDDVTLMVVKKT